VKNVPGRIFVSVDAEGMPFVPSRYMLMPGDKLWDELREIMTRIVSIIVGEATSAGFEVVVADSHGSMVNIDPLKLQEAGPVTLVRGFPRPLSMVAGSRGASAAFLVGYHTAPGAGGVLAHTYSGRIIHRVEVEGCKDADEYILNTYALGEDGIPVALVAGDSRLAEHVREHTPWAVFVPLKDAVSVLADSTPPLHEVERRLREGVRSALARIEKGEAKPLKPSNPTILVDFNRPAYADAASMFPCTERIDGTRVKLKCNSFRENYRLLEGLVLAAYALERI
jgi:D-amino peptidase